MAARSFKLLRSFALTSLFTLIPACAAHSTSSGLSYPQGRPSLAPDTFNASIKESEPGQLPLFALQPERSAGAIDNNTNPLALAQLFRRQACSFNHNGSPRTCNDPSNKCCYDPNNSREGWCCDMTDFCGHNTGTDQRCTYRITYTTSTYWVTEYTTKTSTFISSIAGTTEWTTVAITIYVTVSTDAGIATVWDEITVLAPRVGRKGREVEMTKAHTPLPSPANAVPSITADTKYPLKPRKVHQPQVTEPPRFIKIRGLLYPRQSMRTDTSEYVVTSTSWVTRVSEITSLITYDQTSTRYDTTTSTHTAAVDAHTTVTHSSTVTLQPGETAPSSDKISSGGGDRKSRRGLSIGARIGIGIGVALGLVLIVAIIGFFINKKKVQQPGAPGDGKHPAFFFRNPPSAARFYTPISPPPSDLMYSQASDSPRYTTPSPGTQYTYLPVLAPVFKERPAMGTAQMGPPPISYTLMQQHYQVFQNPKPPSPVVGRQTPSPAPTAPASAPPEYQAKETSETPILHSPHPYRG